MEKVKHILFNQYDIQRIDRSILEKALSNDVIEGIEKGIVQNDNAMIVSYADTVAHIEYDPNRDGWEIHFLEGQQTYIVLDEIIRIAMGTWVEFIVKHPICDTHGFLYYEERWRRTLDVYYTKITAEWFRSLEATGWMWDCENEQKTSACQALKFGHRLFGIYCGEFPVGFFVLARTSNIVPVFYICPAMRRMGIGKRVVSELMRKLSHSLSFVACCDCSFYSSRGFRASEDAFAEQSARAIAKSIGSRCCCVYSRSLMIPQFRAASEVMKKVPEKTIQSVGKFIVKCVRESKIDTEFNLASFVNWMKSEPMSVLTVVMVNGRVAAVMAAVDTKQSEEIKQMIAKGLVGSSKGSSIEPKREGTFVGELFVDPAWQRYGLGQTLLSQLNPPLSLTVDADNFCARRFYQTLGFQLTPKRETRHYEMVCDDVITPRHTFVPISFSSVVASL
jgi:GNAT superfamily N-acetyltransferase